jgi:hypothetical protein
VSHLGGVDAIQDPVFGGLGEHGPIEGWLQVDHGQVEFLSPIDHHEPLRPENDLDIIFTKRATRILSKNLEFQYDRVVYQIQTDRPTYALRKRKVTVCENEKGEITVLLNNEPLQFERFYKQPKQNAIASSKDIERRSYKPAKDHPWRTYGKKINGKPVPSTE